jgi:hypothetical protein
MPFVVSANNEVMPVVGANIIASRLIVVINFALVFWGMVESYMLLKLLNVWSFISRHFVNLAELFWSPFGLSVFAVIAGSIMLFVTAKITDEICDGIGSKIVSLKQEIMEKEQQIAHMQATIDELQRVKIQIPKLKEV